MRKRALVPVALMAAALMLVAGFAFAGRGTVAQDAGTAVPMMAHPAHIHTGTCDQLGEVVFPLEDLVEGNMMAGTATPMSGDTTSSDMAAGAMASPTPGNVVAMSETTVNATLDVILGAQHAINVHESMDAIQNYIACGEITGTASNGELTIQLNELNGSGYTGQATLKDNGDGTTTVTVWLMHGDGIATPMAG